MSVKGVREVGRFKFINISDIEMIIGFNLQECKQKGFFFKAGNKRKFYKWLRLDFSSLDGAACLWEIFLLTSNLFIFSSNRQLKAISLQSQATKNLFHPPQVWQSFCALNLQVLQEKYAMPFIVDGKEKKARKKWNNKLNWCEMKNVWNARFWKMMN